MGASFNVREDNDIAKAAEEQLQQMCVGDLVQDTTPSEPGRPHGGTYVTHRAEAMLMSKRERGKAWLMRMERQGKESYGMAQKGCNARAGSAPQLLQPCANEEELLNTTYRDVRVPITTLPFRIVVARDAVLVVHAFATGQTVRRHGLLV